MGRAVMYTMIVVLGVFVLFATFIVHSGEGEIGAVRVTSIHELTLSAPIYENTHVTTEGLLLYSGQHDQYQVVDDSGHGANYAVLVLNYDHDRLSELAGKRVRVTGLFDYDARSGVYIEAEIVVAVAG
jgi:hypothetical protein